MATSNPLLLAFISGRSALRKRTFIEALESYNRTRVAGIVFFALRLVIIARRALRRMYSPPGGSGIVAAQIHFYRAVDV
jgi:hypothetical protein